MDVFQYGKGFFWQILFFCDQVQKCFFDVYDLCEDLICQVCIVFVVNFEVFGLYVVFEFNVLDGKDELFVDQFVLGSNDKGCFFLYWVQVMLGQLEFELMIEFEFVDISSGFSGVVYNVWYICLKESG